MKLKTMYNAVICGIFILVMVIGGLLVSFASLMNASVELFQNSEKLVTLSNDVLNTNNYLVKLMRLFVVSNDTQYLDEYTTILNDYESFNGKLDQMAQIGLTQSEQEHVDEMLALLDELAAIEGRALEAYENGDVQTAEAIIISDEYNQADDNLADYTTGLIDEIQTRSDKETAAATKRLHFMMLLIGGVLLVFLGAILVIQIIQRNHVLQSLRRLMNLVSDVARGSFNVSKVQREAAEKNKDEIGLLSKEIMRVVSTLQVLQADIEKARNWAVTGQLTRRIDDDEKIKGSYRDIVHSFNRVVDVLVGHINLLPIPIVFADQSYQILFINQAGLALTGLTERQAAGKPCYECLNTNGCNSDACPGRKAMKSGSAQVSELIAGSTEILMHSIPFKDETGAAAGFIEIAIDQTEIKQASREAERHAEEVAKQMIITKKQSDYQKMGVQSMIKSLEKLSRGDLDIQMNDMCYDEDTKEVREAFYELDQTLVGSCANIRSYIDELSEILEGIARKDLNAGITREYMGNFAALKISINDIADTLNEVFGEINSATSQVQTGSQQVANSAQMLAQGASEQAGAVQQISAKINEVAAQTKMNAQNAAKANEISLGAKDDAETGSKQMDDMVNAMEAIKEASKGIAGIIKAIEDIAFQTNILALNAAVEAARAGEHGKGFAVVAEEVRTLAARSAAAAKETTEMIDNSLARVEAGSRIASDTAQALSKIVSGVTGTVDIVATIAEASAQQATAIAQIDEGIEQISRVTQSNTATAEQSASASEEMAGQAQMLENMIESFHLRGQSGRPKGDASAGKLNFAPKRLQQSTAAIGAADIGMTINRDEDFGKY